MLKFYAAEPNIHVWENKIDAGSQIWRISEHFAHFIIFGNMRFQQLFDR